MVAPTTFTAQTVKLLNSDVRAGLSYGVAAEAAEDSYDTFLGWRGDVFPGKYARTDPGRSLGAGGALSGTGPLHTPPPRPRSALGRLNLDGRIESTRKCRSAMRMVVAAAELDSEIFLAMARRDH
jgi:hypothetical protein